MTLLTANPQFALVEIFMAVGTALPFKRLPLVAVTAFENFMGCSKGKAGLLMGELLHRLELIPALGRMAAITAPKVQPWAQQQDQENHSCLPERLVP